MDYSNPLYPYSVEKYVPGGTPTVIASGNDKHIIGLRFNKSDHNLYAIQEEHLTTTGLPYDFIQMTTAGAVTMTVTLPFDVNDEFYSAAIDACTNTYLLSRINDLTANTGLFYKIKTADGSYPAALPTTGIAQGMIETNQ